MAQPLHAAAVCPSCAGAGHVCEDHPDLPWGPLCCALGDRREPAGVCVHGSCHCGGAGAPCPLCCRPVEPNGLYRIGDAFTPGLGAVRA